MDWSTAQQQDEEQRLGRKRLHEVTWLTAHNAHANYADADSNPIADAVANQRLAIYDQLSIAGVRGLMLDMRWAQGAIKLVHGPVDYGLLEDVLLNEIVPFLESDLNSVITLDLQTLGDRDLLMNGLRNLLMSVDLAGFTDRIFRISDDLWTNHSNWPTLEELRSADQRVVIMSDSPIIQSAHVGIMWKFNITSEYLL